MKNSMKTVAGNAGLTAAITVFLGVLQLAGVNSHAEGHRGDARTLLLEAARALAGENDLGGWSTRVETGLLKTTWPGWGELRAKCTRVVKKPDKAEIDNDFSAFNHPFFMTYFKNGDDTWYEVNLNSKRSPRVTASLEEFVKRVDGIAFYLKSSDTLFMAGRIQDDSLLAASDLRRVGCVLKGDTTFIDLDRNSNLPVRTITHSGSRVTILDDYRSTGGIQMPYHVTVYENGSKAQEFLWEEILFDRPVADEIFEQSRPAR